MVQFSIRPALGNSGNREPGDRSLLSPTSGPSRSMLTTPKLDISEVDFGAGSRMGNIVSSDPANS